jgi:hypothetical protein
MKKRLFISCLILLITINSEAQQQADIPLTYSRILTLDSITKSDIYDRALVWCSKAFVDSKSAINVKDKESGIIGGKAIFDSYFKIPRKKDSVMSTSYTNYLFDWLIEIKEAKVRISLSNILVKEFSGDYPVTINGKPPIKFAFTSDEKNKMYWDLAKQGFIKNIDSLVNSLQADIIKKDNW